ncbi:transcriptional regulator [Streptomyces sp. SA15]|uniref:helix-turn-helix domain-containing protein n=1 Tax=Streptomyces sp. SA15 TaxID=934019 RepID=UPI000BAFFE1D|nr:helix-turn-helix domain-containing protein [Streptomyces sp. SA15]PAZ15865.1 transcriptional regulator [Streptomyces sp. SA15]
MTDAVDTDRPDPLTVLRLLAEEVPSHRFEELLLRADQTCSAHERDRLEQAVRLAHVIHASQHRRRQREDGLAELVDTARDMTHPHDLGELMRVISRRVKRIIKADMACIGLPEDDGTLRLHAVDGATTGLWAEVRLAMGSGQQAMTTGAPLWTADYLNDDRFEHSPQADELVRAEGIRSLLAVPLVHGDGTLGVLFCASRTVRHLTPDEIGLACSLAALGALALKRAERLQDASDEVSELESDGFRTRTALARLQQLADVRSHLMGLLLSGADLDILAQAAADALDGTVQLRNPAGLIITATAHLPDLDDNAVTEVSWDAQAQRTPMMQGEDTWVAPVVAGAENLGFAVLRPATPLIGEDERLLYLITQIFALQLLLQHGTAAAEGPVHDELFDELIALPSGGSRRAHRVEQRLSRAGLDPAAPHVLLAVRIEGGSHGRAMMWASSYAHRQGGLKTARDGNIVLLLPGTDASDTARSVADELSAVLGHPVTVGASGPGRGPTEAGRLHQEAVRCLEALTTLDAIGSAAAPDDLGFVGLLLSEGHDVGGFIENSIGPLLAYDRENDTDLVKTLEAYFATGASPSKAADTLHIHANTVSRRLERVTALLDPQWQQPGRALDIQLALRIHRMRALLRADTAGAPHA